jgi:carboxymethylenebutenolidase
MPNQLESQNRREFLMTKLAAGFAAAVSPITAATITTDASSLAAGEVSIPLSDGQMPGYRAMPDKGSRFPVILVVEEIFGVHEHIKDLCRRLAKAGYFAIAPELFARQGDVSKIENIQEILSKVVSKVPDSQVMSDLDSTVAWADKTGKADTARLGITGFCWGGRVVWLYAAHSSKLKAGAAWYGQIVGQVNELRPKTVLQLAASMKAPVLGLYGGKDTGIPPDQVEQMRTALKTANKPSEIILYPDAQHGFNADYRPSYSETDAKDASAKMLAWFKNTELPDHFRTVPVGQRTRLALQ